METPKIFESEYRFCQILWAHEPVKSRELVALCAEHLGWKPTTTYTVIKRLSERGVLKNASLDKSRALLSLSLGGGGRGRAVSYGSAYWYRFGICCVCLLFAALLELWLVPQFLLLAAS